MNDFFKKLLNQIKTVWGSWKTTQRLIFFGVVGAVVLGVVLIFAFSAGPNLVPVFTQPIKDPAAMDRITQKLDEEGIKVNVGADGRLLVPDDKTARRARTLLLRDDLVPSGTNPWDFLNVERWTTTDFERNVNLRIAIQKQLEEHLTALDDLDAAKVVLQIPEKTLFSEDQDPVTASVILTVKPGSDMPTNRKKILGVEKLIQMAVPGLKREGITITTADSGEILNDWANIADSDKLDLKKRMLKIKREEEQKYIKSIRTALNQMFGDDRVNILNVDVTLELGDKTVNRTDITPIWIQRADPRNPAIEPKYEMSTPVSESKFSEKYQGSGFNPEGPAGQEGQTPPAYKDLSGVVGTYDRSDNKTNYEMNKATTQETPGPTFGSRSIAVALDGQWKKVFDDKGVLQRNPDGSIKREYIPLSKDELNQAQSLIEGAMAYNADRQDLIRVENIKFDRTKEFAKEDEDIRRAEQTQQIVLWSLVGLAVILLVFIAFRLISREIERRRRLREEELARQHQAMREAALRSAEEESSEVEMSVEDRARLELQEHAINMAREHPEDVAQLIRTWLMEE